MTHAQPPRPPAGPQPQYVTLEQHRAALDAQTKDICVGLLAGVALLVVLAWSRQRNRGGWA
ncbi:MAG: hypothetical protein C0501_26390 [Isosphaera sp.]|nr:hypothetical protein [Isosphaera sp.]